MTQERWTDDERRALEHWTGPTPPSGFAEQVEAALQAPSRRQPRRTWALAGVAAAAGVMAAVGASPQLWRGAVEGEIAVSQREEIDAGHRGVLVAEAGAQASFRVEASGDAVVHQHRGNIFYRVNPGGPFVVHTPAGQVRVTGTCFRIEVTEMKALHAGLLGGVLGAAVAGTLVKVSVAEGSVETRTDAGRQTLRAGEVADLGAGAVNSIPPPESRVEGAPRERREAATAVAELGEDLPVLKARLTELIESQVKLEKAHAELREAYATQEKALEEARAEAKDHDFLDLDQATLARMADRCELRFDLMSLGGSPSIMTATEMDRLEATLEEKSAADEVMAAHYEQLRAQIRALYTEVTGDPDSGSLVTNAMVNEIADKVPEPSVKHAFYQLSAERAGRRVPPPDPSAESPAVRLYRILTTAGDALERELGARLGPEFAKRYRHLDGGWGSKLRGTRGCPGQPE